MLDRIGIFFWGLIAFVFLYIASFRIIQGGFLNYAMAFILLAPFFFIFFIRIRHFWHVLILVFIVASNVTIPIYGFDKLTPAFILMAVSSLVIIMDTAIHKESRIQLNVIDILVLVLSAILTARLLYDRPGFAMLGSSTGGLISSLNLTSATWFYFVARLLFEKADLTRRQLWFALYGVLAVCVITMLQGALSGVLWARYLGGSSFWMLCALCLTLIGTASYSNHKYLYFNVLAALFILMGLISNFRSRMFFFAAEVALVAYFTGRLKKTLVFLSVIGAVGGFAIFGVVKQVPALMERSMSLFVKIENKVDDRRVYGAMGWGDNFRVQLYVMAWERIKDHPLVGSGLGLNVSEALSVLSSTSDRQTRLLALSGSYHNSVVILAVQSGLPSALLFVIISFMITKKFLFFILREARGVVRQWCVIVFAFFTANMFMLLLNGGPAELFTSMIVSGIMSGIMASQGNWRDRQNVSAVRDIDAGPPPFPESRGR